MSQYLLRRAAVVPQWNHHGIVTRKKEYCRSQIQWPTKNCYTQNCYISWKWHVRQKLLHIFKKKLNTVLCVIVSPLFGGTEFRKRGTKLRKILKMTKSVKGND